MLVKKCQIIKFLLLKNFKYSKAYNIRFKGGIKKKKMIYIDS